MYFKGGRDKSPIFLRASVSDTLINMYVINDEVKKGGGVFFILLSVNP